MTAVDRLTDDQVRALHALATACDAHTRYDGGEEHAREDLRALLAQTDRGPLGRVLRSWIADGPGADSEDHERGYESVQDRALRVLAGHPGEIGDLLSDVPAAPTEAPPVPAAARMRQAAAAMRADTPAWQPVAAWLTSSADEAERMTAENPDAERRIGDWHAVATADAYLAEQPADQMRTAVPGEPLPDVPDVPDAVDLEPVARGTYAPAVPAGLVLDITVEQPAPTTLDGIRARAQAATPDPELVTTRRLDGKRPPLYGLSVGDDWIAEIVNSRPDAVLFAHARRDLLALLDRVDELAKARDGYRLERDHARNARGDAQSRVAESEATVGRWRTRALAAEAAVAAARTIVTALRCYPGMRSSLDLIERALDGRMPADEPLPAIPADAYAPVNVVLRAERDELRALLDRIEGIARDGGGTVRSDILAALAAQEADGA